MSKKSELKASRSVPMNVYSVVSGAVDAGVAAGWGRAHKYAKKPSQDTLLECIEAAVMYELSEILQLDSTLEGD